MALLRFIYVFICAFFLVQPDCEAAYTSEKQLHFSQAGIFSVADDGRIVTQHNDVKQELARRDLSAKYSDGRERQHGSAMALSSIRHRFRAAFQSVSSFGLSSYRAPSSLALLLIFPTHSFW